MVSSFGITLTPTRFDADGQRLLYGRFGRDWRIWHQVGSDEARTTGPIYRTRAELLADLERFGRDYGF